MGSRTFASLALALCLAWPAPAQEKEATGGFTLDAEAGIGYADEAGRRLGVYDLGAGGFAFSSRYIDFGAAAHFANDGKYPSTEGWMRAVGNQYFMLDEGYTRVHTEGLLFEIGYRKSLSSIETPYEVFLNPLAPPSYEMAFSYTNGFFQYESRYIAVNQRSANAYGWGPTTAQAGATPKASQAWLDKGVNYRLIAVTFSGFRIGYEESSVYLRGFDPIYFFSPLPSVLTNTLLADGSSPRTQRTEGLNDNSLMGVFADYTAGPVYAEAQLLVDDINLDFLFPPGSSNRTHSLNKLAWSVGGRWELPFGTLGFWHGGATAYTYAATYPSSYDPGTAAPFDVNSIPYEYMYLPTVYFNGGVVDPRDSNVGFPWGENSMAFRMTFDTEAFSGSPWAFGLSGSLEYVINGSKSPDNPWHEYTSIFQIPQRIQMFNVGGAEVLEHILVFHAGVEKRIKAFLVRVGMDVGGDINALGLFPGNAGNPALNEPSLLKPTPGLDRLILDLALTVRFTGGE